MDITVPRYLGRYVGALLIDLGEDPSDVDELNASNLAQSDF